MANVSSVTNHWITGQEGFTTTLASTISSGATTVPLNSVSGYTNGDQVAFVIEPNEPSKKQVFTGTIDTAGVQVTGVVWTEGTNQTHTAGVTVVDYWTATHQASLVKGLRVAHDNDGTLKNGAVDTTAVIADSVVTRPKLASTFAQEVRDGWLTGDLPAVSTVTNNGNRSYDINFASTVASILSPGMRLRITRTVPASTQCADLESSSSQYFNDISVSGITFTDDFVAGAWIKLESYTQGGIIGRYNGTSGWIFQVEANGTLTLRGYNGGAANSRSVSSVQTVPLGRWVHVAAQLDMSAHSVSSTTSYVMIDGVDVPASVAQGGTNPTALIQAGNLEVGAYNGGTTPFDGKISNVFVSSAKITQANIRVLMSRDLTASDTTTYSLASAYTLNNSLADLNATSANNLTAQNGATATNADSPFADAVTPTGATDVALVMAVSGSTATVQTPEGCTVPATGGVSAVAYSTTANPFGWVADKGRWEVRVVILAFAATSGTLVSTNYNPGGINLALPVGAWELGYELNTVLTPTATFVNYYVGLSTSASSFLLHEFSTRKTVQQTATSNAYIDTALRRNRVIATSATQYFVLLRSEAAFSGFSVRGDSGGGLEQSNVYAIPAGV